MANKINENPLDYEPLKLPPGVDANKPAVQLWKYMGEYIKSNAYERLELARLEILKNSSVLDKKSMFVTKDFKAIKKMNSPEIVAKANPPEEKMVNLFFHLFREAIGFDIPIVLRSKFFQLARPEIVPFKSRVTMLDQESTDMFFVCNGAILQFTTNQTYNDFLSWERQKAEEAKISSMSRQNPQWSDMAKVGRVLLKFVMKSQTLKTAIDFHKEHMSSSEFEAQISVLTGISKIQAEQTFGDFSLITEKNYKKQCNLVVRSPTLVLRIKPSQVAELFSQSLVLENMTIIQQAFPGMTMKPALMRKMCRCFLERTYAPKAKLVKEGEVTSKISILVEGTCAVTRQVDPYQTKLRRVLPKSSRGNTEEDEDFLEEKIKVVKENNSQIGLTENLVPDSLRKFNLGMLEVGSVIATEALFTENHTLNYSVRAKTHCKFLEVDLNDFRVRVSKEVLRNLKKDCLAQQIARIVRVRQIHQQSQNFREQNSCSRFYKESVRTIKAQHPHATESIMKQIETEFALQGTIRIGRQKGNLRVGEISKKHGDRRNSLGENDENSYIAVQTERQRKLGINARIQNDSFEKYQGPSPVSSTGKPIKEERVGRRLRLELKEQAYQEEVKQKGLSPQLQAFDGSSDIARLSALSVGFDHVSLFKPAASTQADLNISVEGSPRDSVIRMSQTNKYNSVGTLDVSNHKQLAVSALKSSQQSMIQGMVMPVREVADSEAYSDDNQSDVDFSRQEYEDDLPPEVIAHLLSTGKSLEDQPIYIQLPSDQEEREKVQPLKEWRAQTVDQVYKDRRGKTVQVHNDDAGTIRQSIIFNKKAARQAVEKLLNTPKRCFALPNDVPAVRQKYGGEDYASLSPQRKETSTLPNINTSHSRSYSSTNHPQTTISSNKALLWDMIMAKGDRHKFESHLFRQSALYQSQMMTDKLRKALLEQARIVRQEQMKKVQVNNLNQGSSILMGSNDSVQNCSGNGILPSLTQPLNQQSVAAIENDATTVVNTIDKELFEEANPRNIDGGEDSPQIGDVKISVKRPMYQLGGRDTNLEPGRNINSNSQAAQDLKKAMERDLEENELANNLAQEANKIFAREGVFMGSQLGANNATSKLSGIQFDSVKEQKQAKDSHVVANETVYSTQARDAKIRESGSKRDLGQKQNSRLKLNLSTEKLEVYNSRPCSDAKELMAQKISNLKSIREKGSSNMRYQVTTPADRLSKNNAIIADVGNIAAPRESMGVETNFGSEIPITAGQDSFRKGYASGKQHVASNSDVHSETHKGKGSEIDKFNKYIKDKKRQTQAGGGSLASTMVLNTQELNQSALMKKSAGGNMAQRVRESAQGILRDGSRARNRRGRLSSLGGSISSAYNFEGASRKEKVQVPESSRLRSSGMQIKQATFAMKPEPPSANKFRAKNGSRYGSQNDPNDTVYNSDMKDFTTTTLFNRQRQASNGSDTLGQAKLSGIPQVTKVQPLSRDGAQRRSNGNSQVSQKGHVAGFDKNSTSPSEHQRRVVYCQQESKSRQGDNNLKHAKNSLDIDHAIAQEFNEHVSRLDTQMASIGAAFVSAAKVQARNQAAGIVLLDSMAGTPQPEQSSQRTSLYVGAAARKAPSPKQGHDTIPHEDARILESAPGSPNNQFGLPSIAKNELQERLLEFVNGQQLGAIPNVNMFEPEIAERLMQETTTDLAQKASQIHQMRKEKDAVQAVSPRDSSQFTGEGGAYSLEDSKTLNSSRKRKNTHVVSLADSADLKAQEGLKQIRRHIMRKLRKNKRRERKYASMLHAGATEENKRKSTLHIINANHSPTASEKSADAAQKNIIPDLKLTDSQIQLPGSSHGGKIVKSRPLSPGEMAKLNISKAFTFRQNQGDQLQDIAQLYAADAHKPATLLFDGKKEMRNNRKGLKQNITTVRNAPENMKTPKDKNGLPQNERMTSRYVNQDNNEEQGTKTNLLQGERKVTKNQPGQQQTISSQEVSKKQQRSNRNLNSEEKQVITSANKNASGVINSENQKNRQLTVVKKE